MACNKQILQYTKDLIKTNGKELALRIAESCEKVAAQSQHVTLADELDPRNPLRKELRLRRNRNFWKAVVIELKRGNK